MESLAAPLMAAFVVFTALSHTLAQFMDWSIYPLLLLILVLLNAIILLKSRDSFWTGINAANFSMLGFIASLVIVVETLDGLETILGAILLPYTLGAIYAFRKPDGVKIEEYLLLFLVLKSLLVLFFLDGLLAEFPVRPQFEGRAIYLQFGWALDVAPFLITYYLLVIRKVSALNVSLVALAMFVLAFVIVAMASRTMLLLSVAFTALFSLIFFRDIKLKFFGILIYPVSVLLFLMIFPSKQEHLLSMLTTVKDMAYMGQVSDGADKSSAIRLRGFWDTFFMTNLSTKEHSLELSSKNFYWAGHFWFGQIKYYTGYLGLFLFISVLIFFLIRLYQIFQKMKFENCFYTVTIIAFSVSYSFHVFYVGGILNDPIFFFFLGLVVNSGEQKSFWNFSPNNALLTKL